MFETAVSTSWPEIVEMYFASQFWKTLHCSICGAHYPRLPAGMQPNHCCPLQYSKLSSWLTRSSGMQLARTRFDRLRCRRWDMRCIKATAEECRYRVYLHREGQAQRGTLVVLRASHINNRRLSRS